MSLSPDIRIFLQKAYEDPLIVAQFLRSGGRPLDIAQILNKVDKSELFHISYIFNGIHLILIEKLTKSTDLSKESEAIEVCSYLLNNHRICIEKLLASNYATHKKAVLKLLTAVVYLAPHLGRELLTTFNVAFNTESLKGFTAHERNECSLPDEDRVRTCYIYFILAYIIEGNHTLIKNILDRNELVMAVVSGLIYDSEKTVLLVMNSLVKFVLKSDSVSKTKKVQVFGVNVVKEILRLFDWKGPGYFAALFNRKKKDKADQFVKPDELNSVSDSVYEFLKELLASRKNGIAFKCLGNRRTKFNAVQKKVILMIDHFWEHEQKANLTIDILKACPELTKHFMQKHASKLDPFKKQSSWYSVADFFARLIDEMTPNIIQYQVDNMNSKETIELIKEICMAPEILQQLRSKHTLKNDNLIVRHKSTNLLYLMFKQCNQFLFNIAKWNVYRTNDVKKMKFELINHILLLCPTVENILLSLHMSQFDETADNGKMFEHLECILDLLLIITKSIPSFIDTSSSVINYIKILGPIYELNREHKSSTRIEFKAVKLILALEPKALSPKTELFEQVTQSFFNVYRFGLPIEQYEAKILLRNVFHNTGLFENGSLEVDLWLEALNFIDEDVLPAVKQFLIKHINEYNVNDTQLIRNLTISNDSGGKNISEIFNNIEKGVTLKGVLDVPTLGHFFQYIVERYGSNEDAMECDENDGENGLLQYLEIVAFYLFHYLPMPETVYSALESTPHKFSAYMEKWIKNSKATSFPSDVEPELLKKYYNALIKGKPETFLEIFKSVLTSVSEDNPAGENDIIVKINEIDYKLTNVLNNETQVMIFIYLTVSVANLLHRNNAFDAEQCHHVVDYFKEFINILEVISLKNSDTSKSGFEFSDIDNNCTAKALKYIFTNCFYLLQSFDLWNNQNYITQLIFELVKNVIKIDGLDEILVHYRRKVCNQIELAVLNTNEAHTLPSMVHASLIDILDAFHLDFDNCSAILQSLTKLNFKNFVTPENDRSVYTNIMAHTLQRLAQLKVQPLDEVTVEQLSTIYINLVRNVTVEINYEAIENALYVYLTVFYHSIGHLNDDLFEAIFESKKLTKSGVKLACLLLERKPNLADRFKELLAINVTKKELIYPLINVIADTKWTIDAKLLATIYSEYKNGVLKAIEKPQKAAVIYKENVISSVFLVEKCMPLNECVDFLKKSINFESADVFQLQIIKAIHLKILMHSDKVETIKNAYENFLQVFIQLFGLLLRRDPLDYEKINAFAYIAYNWTKLKEKLLPVALLPSIKYESIRGSQIWHQMGKSCLKHGLKYEIDSTNKINDESEILLKLFGYLCNQFYENGKNHDDAKTFFEMTVTHPNFFDIAVLQRKSAIKTNLMYLLCVLVQKNNEAIDAEHIPVFLSGYQAKMSHSDQYILAILQLYEQNGIDMHKFKPFMWGESALSHYSLGASATVKATLFQEPPMMQVMALVDRDLSENTLVNYPIWRRLNVIEQTPDIEFTWHGIPGDDYSNHVSAAKSNIEKLVENGSTNFNNDILLASSRRDETYDDVYDPAFFIPIMQMAFAPETFSKPVRPAQNGLLAVTFAALSSSDKDMRLAAGSALLRYRNHLESSRFVDSKLWFHLFDSIKNGLGILTTEARKQKKNRIPRVPYISGLFFARTLNTLVNPLSEMYRPLSAFLLIKNSFNFLTVPEFNVLFHSPDVNHNTHRSFVLEVLRDGTKCSSDFTILMTGNIFKALLGFYGSPMTTREKSLQILTVVNAAVKIPKSTKLMIELVGILPWLSSVTDNIEFFQFDIIDMLCTIINNLYYSVVVNQQDYTSNNIEDIKLRCLNLLLKICPNLSTRIAEISFVRYLNVLEKVTAKSNRIKFLTDENIKHLIKCTAGYVNEQMIWDCNFIMEKNDAYKYCDTKYNYIRKLRESALSEQVVFILSNLRELIINWTHYQQN